MTSRLLLLTLSLVALAPSASSPASAQDQSKETARLRIATVDMKRLFAAHPGTKAEEKKVLEEREAIKKELKEKTEALKMLLDQFQLLTIEIEKGGSADTLKAKRARAAELAKKSSEMERKLAQLTSQRETEVKRRILTARQAILVQIRDSIHKVNAQAGFQLVLDRAATSGNGLPMILDTKDIVDLTDRVLASFPAK